MRFAIFSDLHANYYAIRAVGEDAVINMDVPETNFWCLGDVVGYGPHPVQAIRFLRDFVAPDRWVLGNHDAMLADLVLPEEIPQISNPVYRVRTYGGNGAERLVKGLLLSLDQWQKTTNMPVDVIEKHRRILREHPSEDVFWRQAFVVERTRPVVFVESGICCVLVHASQVNPLSRYIYAWDTDILLPTEFKILRTYQQSAGQTVVQFFGHTHVPTFICARPEEDNLHIEVQKIYPGQSFVLEEGGLYLINPGSVGQPRDRDARASYVVFDVAERCVTFRRVTYDYVSTARDLAIGEYPDSLIRRLKTAAAAEKEIPQEWLEHFEQAKKYG